MKVRMIFSILLCVLFLFSLTACSKSCEKIKLKTDEIVFTEEGDSYKLKVTVTPKDTTDEIEFESDDEDVATVDDDGEITAVGEGTTITVTCGDESEECEVICDFSGQLGGYGEDSGPSGNPGFSGDHGTTENGVTTYKIGVAIYSYNDNFMTRYRQELEAYFGSLETETEKYEIYMVDCQSDMALQQSHIESFIAQEMDLVILNPVIPDSSEVLVDLLVDAQIPTIIINREPPASVITDNPNVCYVGLDPRHAGTVQGEIILNLDDHGDINGDGVVKYVMIVGDPENIEAQYRTEYAIKVFDAAGIQVECLVMEVGMWDQVKGNTITAAAIAEYGDEIDVIFCNNDGMALGAYDAIVSYGLDVGTDIYLVGIDALDECVYLVQNGEMTGTVKNDYVAQSHTVADVAIRILNGEQMEDYYRVDYVPIT